MEMCVCLSCSVLCCVAVHGVLCCGASCLLCFCLSVVASWIDIVVLLVVSPLCGEKKRDLTSMAVPPEKRYL